MSRPSWPQPAGREARPESAAAAAARLEADARHEGREAVVVMLDTARNLAREARAVAALRTLPPGVMYEAARLERQTTASLETLEHLLRTIVRR